VEFAYKPELWQSLFDMCALAAVTLSGLIFVGLSINLRNVVSSPVHLARAREALIALTVLLTVAIFVLIPEQGRVPVGIELIALSVLVWVLSLRLPRGVHLYSFVLDGAEWRPDPSAPLAADDSFGGHNSVIVVDGAPGL